MTSDPRHPDSLRGLMLAQQQRLQRENRKAYEDQEDRTLTGRLVDAGIRDGDASALGGAIAPTAWADHIRGQNPATLVATQLYNDGFQNAFIQEASDDPQLAAIFRGKMLQESNIRKLLETGLKQGWNTSSRLKTAADKYLERLASRKHDG